MRLLTHWLEEYTAAESLDILREFALAHALLGGERGLEIVSLIKRDRIKELCLYQIDPSWEGWNPEELYHCRQAVAFFSKLENLEIGIDKEEAALKSFWEAERLCMSTNEIFRLEKQGKFMFPLEVNGWLYRATCLIAKALGNVPSKEQLGYRFGKGSTTLTKKRDASIRRKLADGAACSEELLPSAQAYMGELPALAEVWSDSSAHSEIEDDDGFLVEEESWYSIPFQIMDGNLEFVSKNAKTKRGIVAEPPLNTVIQLGWGDYIAGLLKRVGLDLRDQSRNRNLAREGSLTGALATLDLKSASDCMAVELVYSLLPLEWAHQLAQCRTGHVVHKGTRVRLEKFSSMGNGVTFPLETLIFWGLARSVCSDREVVSVYGDDIILPAHRFQDLVRLLTAVGFIPNTEKSYFQGPFRESCGSDFYSGTDVRPYFQKKWVSPATLFTLHNFYVRGGRHDFAKRVLDLISSDHNVFGPDGFGDGHLIGEHPRKRKARHDKAGYSGYLFDTYVQTPRRDCTSEGAADHALPSYIAYQRGAVPLVPALAELDVSSKEVLRMPTRLARALAGGKSPVGDDVRSEWPSESSPLPTAEMQNGSQFTAVSLPITDQDRTYTKKSVYTW